jgi:hypothetical protein
VVDIIGRKLKERMTEDLKKVIKGERDKKKFEELYVNEIIKDKDIKECWDTSVIIALFCSEIFSSDLTYENAKSKIEELFRKLKKITEFEYYIPIYNLDLKVLPEPFKIYDVIIYEYDSLPPVVKEVIFKQNEKRIAEIKKIVDEKFDSEEQGYFFLRQENLLPLKSNFYAKAVVKSSNELDAHNRAVRKIENTLNLIRFCGGGLFDKNKCEKSNLVISESCIYRTSSMDSFNSHQRFMKDPFFFDEKDISLIQKINDIRNNSDECSRAICNSIDIIGTACEMENEEMKILLLMTALESLMGIPGREIQYKLSDAVAFLVGEALSERRRIKRQIECIYAIRSVITHTGRMKALKEKCKEALRYAHFSIDASFEKYLNKGNISKGLRKEFENGGFSLSDTATVTKEGASNWGITDKEKFSVRKDGGMLNVYRSDESDHIRVINDEEFYLFTIKKEQQFLMEILKRAIDKMIFLVRDHKIDSYKKFREWIDVRKFS